MQIINPASIYNSPRYASGVRAGSTIYTAGRVPINVDGSVYAPNDPAAQTEQILQCLKVILAEGGATLKDVVLIHTYYLYQEDMTPIFEVMQKHFEGHRPPHTGMRQDSISWKERGIRLEIEFVAVVEE
jgi:enamine deaminase RidA (YjgF/YER057c/UK114 family)